MARARMIARTLSTSRRYAALFDVAGPLAEFCQSLYPLIVAHTDDFGRMEADAHTIKFGVHPCSPRTLAEFDEAIGLLARAGLIVTGALPNGDRCLQVVSFERHQPGLHKRTASRFPELPEESEGSREVHGESRNAREVPSEEKRTELKGTEGKGSEGSAQNALGAPIPREPMPFDKPKRARNVAITATLNAHRSHYDSPAACARGVCIPASLGAEWEAQIGADDPADARAQISEAVAFALAQLPPGPVTEYEDAFKFWRPRWTLFHRQPKAQSAAHDPATEALLDRAGVPAHHRENWFTGAELCGDRLIVAHADSVERGFGEALMRAHGGPLRILERSV